MEDTPREIKQKFREILLSKTEEERILMCAEMFDSAREIAISTMPDNLSEAEKKRFIYKKLSGEDLPKDFPEFVGKQKTRL